MAVASSKFLFYEVMKNHPRCGDLIHPWNQNCFKMNVDLMPIYIVGVFKFMAVWYLCQMLVKFKKVNKDSLKKEFKAFIRSYIFASGMGIIFFCSSCIIRNVLGKYFYYTAISLPAFLSTLPNKIETFQRREMYLNAAINFCLQIAKKNLGMKNLSLEIIFFMVTNSYFMYLLRTEKENRINFWFEIPPKFKEINKKSKKYCPHSETCEKYIIDGTVQYLLIGYALAVLKITIANNKIIIKSPLRIFGLMLSRNILKLPAFFATYVGLYRGIHCYLCRRNRKDDTKYTLLAGFLAGISYYFEPGLPFLVAPLASTIRILITKVDECLFSNSKVSLDNFAFPIFFAILFHTKIFTPESCPNFMHDMINMGTQGRSAIAEENYARNVQQVIQSLNIAT